MTTFKISSRYLIKPFKMNKKIHQVALTHVVYLGNKYQLEKIENAKIYIELNFKENISLENMAMYCHQSLFHFCRVFKKATAITPHQYLQKKRLSTAEKLLAESTYSITEVAKECGFNSVEYFSTVFKREYLINPGQYRREIKSKMMTTEQAYLFQNHLYK